jgi:hypothetical protein
MVSPPVITEGSTILRFWDAVHPVSPRGWGDADAPDSQDRHPDALLASAHPDRDDRCSGQRAVTACAATYEG